MFFYACSFLLTVTFHALVFCLSHFLLYGIFEYLQGLSHGNLMQGAVLYMSVRSCGNPFLRGSGHRSACTGFPFLLEFITSFHSGGKWDFGPIRTGPWSNAMSERNAIKIPRIKMPGI